MSVGKRFKQFIKIFIVGFVVLFLLRLAYGYYTTPNAIRRESPREAVMRQQESFSVSKKNYASDSYKLRGESPAATPQSRAALDQKYEKTADVVTATNGFDEDDKKLRTEIDDCGAIVQYEQNSGTTGKRVLQMMIGVAPAKFDEFYDRLLKIGKIESTTITKIDKTNEFLNLKAQRASLEETRRALVDLKSRNGRIEELVALQEKILEVERQLRELGVKLGEYDEVNEFCTVRLSLYEDREILVYPPSLVTRIKVAFDWTVRAYTYIAFILALGSIAALMIAIIVERVLMWAKILSKPEE